MHSSTGGTLLAQLHTVLSSGDLQSQAQHQGLLQQLHAVLQHGPTPIPLQHDAPYSYGTARGGVGLPASLNAETNNNRQTEQGGGGWESPPSTLSSLSSFGNTASDGSRDGQPGALPKQDSKDAKQSSGDKSEDVTPKKKVCNCGGGGVCT